ncbi:MAG TPA: LuxR C-terminal-related transcriptional regulator [Allosphingosinicella sp.]|jgi:two-component system response regulator FixJ
MSRTVYLIDDQSSSRRDLIARLGDLDLETWPFAAAAQFTSLLPQLQPAPLLLSMDLEPGGAGLAILDEMAASGRQWPVVAFGTDADMRTAVEAMKRGAVDFLAMPVPAPQFAAAVEAALALLDEAAGERALREDAQARLAALTPRELEVVRALVGGMGNKTAAHRLGLSVRTVEMHRSRLLRKLGVRSLAEAAILVAYSDLGARRPALGVRRGASEAAPAPHP